MGASQPAFCKNDPPVVSVIGSGKFGIVFIHDFSKPEVVKMYREATECGAAKDEFDLQKRIYNGFTAGGKTENPYISHMAISEPFIFCNRKKGYTVNQQKYACFAVMSQLQGIPMSIAYQVIPQHHWRQWESSYLQSISPNYPIMIHTAFSIEFQTKRGPGFYDSKWEHHVDGNDALRGYFCDRIAFQNFGVLDELTKKYEFGLTETNIDEIIGFVYSFMLYKLELIAADIEFVIGLYSDGYRINILDFGLVRDLNNNKGWKGFTPFLTGPVKQWIDSGKEDWSGLAQFLGETYMNIQYYGDASNQNFQNGWKIGRDGGASVSLGEISEMAHGASLIDNDCLNCNGEEEIYVAAKGETINSNSNTHRARFKEISAKTDAETFDLMEQKEEELKLSKLQKLKTKSVQASHVGNNNMFNYVDHDAFIADVAYDKYDNYDNYDNSGYMVDNYFNAYNTEYGIYLVIGLIVWCCLMAIYFVTGSIFSFLFFSKMQKKETRSYQEQQQFV